MNRYKTENGEFPSLGEFLVKVRKYYTHSIPDSRLIIGKTAGHMETGEDSQGGALVPEQWAKELYNVALEGAIVRPRAIALETTSDSLKVRRVVDTDRSSNLFGGVTFTWTAEAASKVTAISKPSFGELELTPHKLVGSFFASNELEDDTKSFGKFMAQVFGRAIRFIEDDAFLDGTGVGMPFGIKNDAGCLIKPARAVANQINWVDISNMAVRLLPDSWNRAVWLINQDALGELFQMVAPAANNVPVVDFGNRTLWGRPIIVTEKCESLGTDEDIILADFGAGHYLIADREMRISASRHVPGESGYLTDETFWKVVLRVDGQPLLDAAITPYKGAATLSPFVALTEPIQ